MIVSELFSRNAKREKFDTLLTHFCTLIYLAVTKLLPMNSFA